MTDVEISSTHLKFTALNQLRTVNLSYEYQINIKNHRRNAVNMGFRLYNMEQLEINPNTLLLKPNEMQVVNIRLRSFEGREDFIYLKGDQVDQRIAISLECQSDRVDQYIYEDVGKRQDSSPGFPEQHLDTFGNQRSDGFLQEENRILQQRVEYLSQQNQLLNDALEQFLNQDMEGGSIQSLLKNMMEQERQENEFRSQRVLLMIEEKDKEIRVLKTEMFNSTQKQVQDLINKNERLQLQLQELQARENYYQQKEQDSEKEGYLQLYRKYESLNERNKYLERMKDEMNEELSIMAQRLDESGNLGQSQIVQEPNDKMVNRLNARITQLKLREERLLEENAQLEDLLKDRQIPNKKKEFVKDDLLHKEYQILENVKKDLERQYKESQLKNQILEQQCDECTKENGLLSEEIWSQSKELEKLKIEIRKLKEQDFSKERMEYEAQIFALEQTLKQCSSLQEVKDQARQRWEKELLNLKQNHEAELNNYDQEIQGLKRLINNFKEENQILLQSKKEWQFNSDKDLQQQQLFKEQIQDLELRNQKLNKINQQNAIDIEKTKTEFLILRDNTEQEMQRRDNVERQQQDKNLLLQDQINNIMREKSITQQELQQEMNQLCQQHKMNINQLLQDNKQLEQQCLQMQNQLATQKEQFYGREEQLIKEVRQMQDKIENLMLNSKQKRQTKSKSIEPKQQIIQDERKRVDSYMLKIRNLEEELNVARSQKMTLEYDLNRVKQQKQQNVPQDQYISQELGELQETLVELRIEREKVINQLIEKDDLISQLEEQLQEYSQLVQQQQNNLERMESKISQTNEELKKTIEQKNNEIHKYKLELEIKDEQTQVYQEQTKLLQNERRDINEKCYVQGFEIEQIKQNYSEIETSRKNQIQELKTKFELIIRDHQDNASLISNLNKTIVTQKEVYEDTIERQRNIIDLIREKFNQDIQDMVTKQNQYFNVNENIKKSLNPAKETQLQTTIQQYADNVMTLAQNQQKQKASQDKNKQLEKNIALVKQQNKEIQEKNNQLINENQELQKKVDKFRPKIPGSSIKTKTNINPNNINNNKQDQFGPNITILLQEGRLADSEAQTNHYKIQLQLNQTIIDQLTQVNLAYETEIKKIQGNFQQLQDSYKLKEQQNQDQQKIYKLEQQKILNELNQVQNKFVPEDKVQSLQEVLQQKEQVIRDLREELNRKKDVADQFRSDRDQLQGVLERCKKQLEEQNGEFEKLRQKQKDQERKDLNYKDFKEKYEQMKQGEKQACEEIKNLSEKNKQLKQDVQRKEQNIKDLKEKWDQIQNVKPNDQEKQELVVMVKKLKEEINRKDQAIKHFKQKFDDKCQELDSQKNDFSMKYAQTVQELEKEMRRNEQSKISSKKGETTQSMLIFLLKRIYRENYMSVQKQRKEPQKNLAKFSESMNILNLGPEELDEFLEPNMSVTTVKKQSTKDLDRFEQECNNEPLDVNCLFNMINQVIQERVNSN